jgi:hypothetical protein
MREGFAALPPAPLIVQHPELFRLDLLRSGVLHLGVAAGVTLVRVLVLQ